MRAFSLFVVISFERPLSIVDGSESSWESYNLFGSRKALDVWAFVGVLRGSFRGDIESRMEGYETG